MRSTIIDIDVDDQCLVGTLAAPATVLPGLLFLHGWGGSQGQDLNLARDIAALGCVCLTFDLRGHAANRDRFQGVTREDNLRDALAAYDVLAAHPEVDKSTIAVVGSSYGAYLATILSALRPVRWLSLRVPALYRDEDWHRPKGQLDRKDLASYRSGPVSLDANRALKASAGFTGDVLLVESEHDDLIPHQTILSYRAAFVAVRSLTYRVIQGADHALSSEAHRHAYNAILLNWVSEMIIGVR